MGGPTAAAAARLHACLAGPARPCPPPLLSPAARRRSMVEPEPLSPLPASADAAARAAHYAAVAARLELLLEGEADWVAAMATAACELHCAFAYFSWTGFYRAAVRSAAGGQPSSAAPTLLVGPYQGSLGCLRIPFR